MWFLVTNNIWSIILNIVFYAVLFNVIYSSIFSGTRFRTNVIIYIIAMQIKLFITYGSTSFAMTIVSLTVYLIMGLIIVKILYKMADYYTRGVFVVVSIMVAYFMEIVLAKILFFIVGMIIGFIELWLYGIILAIFH